MVDVFSFVSRVPLGASTRSFDSFDLRECFTMHSALLTCALRCSLVRGLVSVWPSVMVGLCWPLAFAWSTQTRNLDTSEVGSLASFRKGVSHMLRGPRLFRASHLLE